MEGQSEPRATFDRFCSFAYALAALVTLSFWLLAIRAPLWLDETASYWNVSGGFRQIYGRSVQINSSPLYFYILWLTKTWFGGREIVLRIPSLLAMLAAVYLLYLAAREMFDRDTAIIAAVICSLHPIVIFAAIDVRPYAFAALAINFSILALIRSRRDNSNWLAALFGLSTAFIIYFQFLFAVILPAFAICFLALKIGDRTALWRQGAVAIATFIVALLPVIPGCEYVLHTRAIHVFDKAPPLAELGWTLAPGRLVYIFGGTILVAAATRAVDLQSGWKDWRILLCATIGLVPILVLYCVSVETSLHVFVYRYRLVAIPGIALCWAWLFSRIDSRALRLVFCLAVVAATAYQYFGSPLSRLHGYTWKYALEVAEKDASSDNAPVLMCSDLPEADHTPIPVGAAVKDSALFAPLTYYRLSVPVVGLPRALNDEARQIILNFVQAPERYQERFLALGYEPSYETLHFIELSASGTHYVRVLGTFDGVAVLEFIPRQADGAGNP